MSRYTSNAANIGTDNNEDDDYDAAIINRIEKDFLRRNISQFHTFYNSLHAPLYSTGSRRDRIITQSHYTSAMDMKAPYFQQRTPQEGICTKFLRRGFTKPTKYQLNAAVWSADGRWLVLGTQSGDFALWEGEALKVHKVVSVPAHKVLTDGGKVQDYIRK